MSDMKKLIESIDSIIELCVINEGVHTPAEIAKNKAFRELGLHQDQWEVFDQTWEYRQDEIDNLKWQLEEPSYNEN